MLYICIFMHLYSRIRFAGFPKNKSSRLMNRPAAKNTSACEYYAGKHSSGSWLPSAETAIRPCSFATPAFTGCAVDLEFAFVCYINYHIISGLSSILCNNIHVSIQLLFPPFYRQIARRFSAGLLASARNRSQRQCCRSTPAGGREIVPSTTSFSGFLQNRIRP